MIVVRRRGEGIRVSQDNDVVYHYTDAGGLKGIWIPASSGRPTCNF